MRSSTAPDPAGRATALDAARLSRAAEAIALPSPELGAWRSPAAVEYTDALARLRRTLQAAADALRSAASAA